MDDRIKRALSRGHLVDITTTGRKTGQPRRIELVFHNFDGRVFISGLPGRRSWLANLEADPDFVFHLKGPIKADLRARARVITDPTERRDVLARVAQVWRRTDLDRMSASSPLIEVEFQDDAPAA
jgi:deazaflavin-dependent oxidoreductase (nitroreductase family)